MKMSYNIEYQRLNAFRAKIQMCRNTLIINA
jgi:hypothetical protein